jgi:DNA-binding XRE family transcriptional regulator
MAGKVQNPESWFYNARLRAGFPNAALLAQRLGVPKGTVYQWERGSAAPSPSFRPPARLMPQIADALKVPLPEAIEALWKEKVGDPCPCGCGGKKVFPDPDQFPGARALVIELPCANAKCGRKRIYKRWKKSRHRKLCSTCATAVERIEFTCVGYQDHNATLHARTCPRTMRLRPCDANARQLLKDNGLESRFDVSAKTYQCNRCASTERLLANKERELRTLAKKFPHIDVPRIRRREQRIKLLRDHHVEMSPNFKPTREAQKLGHRNFAQMGAEGKTWPKMTKANLIRRWWRDELPKRIRFGICIVCKKIAITYSPREPRFHWACHQQWESTPEGKNFQSLRVRGQEARLPPPKRGRPVTEDSLKEAYSWAIRYYFRDISFDEIAGQNNLSPKAVELKVKSIIERLPAPDLVSARFRKPIELLLDASGMAPSHLAPP